MGIETEQGQDLLDAFRGHDERLGLRTIDEGEFRKTLLPIALAVHRGETPPVGNWRFLADSATKGIIVTDGMGDVLFTTPSLYQTVNLRITADFSALKDATDRARETGGDGSAQFAQYVNHNTAILTIPTNSAKAPLAWAEIFSRYGYKMVKVATLLGNEAMVLADLSKSSILGDDEFV
jgi:hypothetical protein